MLGMTHRLNNDEDQYAFYSTIRLQVLILFLRSGLNEPKSCDAVVDDSEA